MIKKTAELYTSTTLGWFALNLNTFGQYFSSTKTTIEYIHGRSADQEFFAKIIEPFFSSDNLIIDISQNLGINPKSLNNIHLASNPTKTLTRA